MYDEHSQIVRKLHTNKENHILDTAILYFCYSRLEKRVSYQELNCTLDWSMLVRLHISVLGYTRQFQI